MASNSSTSAETLIALATDENEVVRFYVAVPLLVLLAVDRIDLAVYASFGAFTGLCYGRNEPYRVRLVSVTAAAIALVGCIAAGFALAGPGQPLWLTAVVLAVVIATCVFATAVIGWVPVQPVFRIRSSWPHEWALE